MIPCTPTNKINNFLLNFNGISPLQNLIKQFDKPHTKVNYPQLSNDQVSTINNIACHII